LLISCGLHLEQMKQNQGLLSSTFLAVQHWWCPLKETCKTTFIIWGNNLPSRLCKNYRMYSFWLTGVVLWLQIFFHVNISWPDLQKRNFISWGNKLPPRLCKNYIMYYFCLSGVVLWLLFFVHINITDQVGPIIISAPSSFPVYLECLQFLWSDSPCLYTFDNGITCFIITFICKPRLSYPCCYRGHLKLPKKLLFYSWCISSNLVWLSLIDPALHSLICPCSMESNTLFQLYHILNIQCRYVFWYYLIQVNDQSNQWSNMIYMIKFFVYLCIKTFF